MKPEDDVLGDLEASAYGHGITSLGTAIKS